MEQLWKWSINLIFLVAMLQTAGCYHNSDSTQTENQIQLNTLIKSMTFDNEDNMYILDVPGNVYKYNGQTAVKIISTNTAGLDFGKTIRYSQNNLYINNLLNVGTDIDQFDEVLRFSSTGEFINRVIDESDIQTIHYSGIDVSGLGQLYVAVFDLTEKFIRIDSDGLNLITFNLSAAPVYITTCLAVAPSGHVYIGTPSGVFKFTTDGQYVSTIIKEGEHGFEFADKLAIDSLGNLIITNYHFPIAPSTTSTSDYIKLDKNNNFLGIFIPAGTAGINTFIEDMIFDSAGNLYIADLFGGIFKFNQTGEFQGIIVKTSISASLASAANTRIEEQRLRKIKLKKKDDELKLLSKLKTGKTENQ